MQLLLWIFGISSKSQRGKVLWVIARLCWHRAELKRKLTELTHLDILWWHMTYCQSKAGSNNNNWISFSTTRVRHATALLLFCGTNLHFRQNSPNSNFTVTLLRRIQTVECFEYTIHLYSMYCIMGPSICEFRIEPYDSFISFGDFHGL